MSREQPLEFANAGAHLLEALAQSTRYSITHVDPVGVIERFTSADVAGAVPLWAQLLRQEGLEQGDRVVVLAGGAWEWRCALLGVLHAGGIAVPCPESTSAAELREIAEHAGVTLVVAIPPRPDLAEQDGLRVLSADQLETVDPAEALARPPHQSLPGDVGLVLYERKDTGLQGTMHTHASLIAQADAGHHWLGIREGERIWCDAVDGSATSIWLLLAAWRARGNIASVDLELDPEAQLELLERLRPAVIWFSDEDYGVLASADAPAWIDLGPIRRALVSDESSAGAVAFADAFGTKVTRLFGQTELGVVAGWPAGAEHDADAETAIAVPGIQLAVVDEQGSELPAGELGEVVVRGDAQSRFMGYVGGEPPRRNSWLRLGWQGALDADRSLRLASRAAVDVSEAEVDLPLPGFVEDAALAALDELAAEPEATSPRSKREAKRARRREEREAKKRQKDDERRRHEEEQSRGHAERVAARERKKAERAGRKAADGEQEQARPAEDQEAKQREQAEQAQREAAEAEKRRREEAARAEREAAEAERGRQAEEAARAEERRREEEERQRAEDAARAERETAEAEERRRTEKAARAEVLRRQDEKTRGGRRRRREEKRVRRQEEREARERQKAEAAERAQREAEAAEERRRAEEAARVEERRRAEDERRREREQRREEKEARRREEQQTKEAARAQRKAARSPLRRRQAKHGREAAEQPEQEQLSREIVSRIKQYGMTTPTADPVEPTDAEASTEPHVAPEPNERREPE